MTRQRLTHLVVYGDREHFANLTYLTCFDPRFEEAVLVLRAEGTPLLVVGNECVGHVPSSPLHAAGALRIERYQTFSLLDQPREASRSIVEIFRGEGIGRRSRIGCVGWKYFSKTEHRDPTHAHDLPSYLVDALRGIAGRPNIVNATAILMHPDTGLRTFCSPPEIAYFEFTNVLASESVKRMIFGAREGMNDYDVIRLAQLSGEPHGAHPSIKTAATRHCSLMSPVGGVLRRGDPLSMGICHWGSNSCRVGWVAGSSRDLAPELRDYVPRFAGPYFEAVAAWLSSLQVGADAGALTRTLQRRLPFKRFGIFLNPGHLIHLDEWVSSPFYPQSKIRLHSGMAIQTDIIPSSRTYWSARMEDGVVLADATLRDALEAQFPACFARCRARRAFMQDTLGVSLSEDVLPLSNIPAIVAPFFLKPNTVFALKRSK